MLIEMLLGFGHFGIAIYVGLFWSIAYPLDLLGQSMDYDPFDYGIDVDT
jgi:hypothetical protein